jgi:nitrite reductase (NADH) small subunit
MSLVLESITDTTPPDSWYPVCVLDDLEPEWGEAALVAGRQVAVFRLWDGSVRAIDNEDPVTGSFVMSRGIVGSRGGRPTIASPLLKQVYDLDTGECLSQPGLSVTRYAVRLVGDRIEINLPQ